MYYQYGQNRIFGAKFDPEIYKRGILFIGSPGTFYLEQSSPLDCSKLTKKPG